MNRARWVVGLAAALLAAASAVGAVGAQLPEDLARVVRAKADIAKEAIEQREAAGHDVRELVARAGEVAELGRAGKLVQANAKLDALFVALRAEPPRVAGRFANPEPVPIRGLPLGAGGTPISTEEPFVSRDGRFLFFNSGSKEGNKDLHYARLNSGDWIYGGEIGPDVNEPTNVQGNPSMDANDTLFFVDSEYSSMIRLGRFLRDSGRIEGLRELEGVPEKDVRLFAQRLHGNMGVEVSADGNLAFFSRATFKLRGTAFGGIRESELLFTRKQGGRFVYDEAEARRVMERINTDDLEYAASISQDERVLYFTRLPKAALSAGKPRSHILVAERASPNDPFGEPRIVEAIGTADFVEGPAITPDGRALYYHKHEGSKFRLYRVTR